jgi:bifunctional DNA-binding transcriptional regulator/antitoxin component of YhaV-PrlF toxin-antitoxin module
MFESKTIIGKSGQITIPKIIREGKNLKNKDKILINIKKQDNFRKIKKKENKEENERIKAYKKDMIFLKNK